MKHADLAELTGPGLRKRLATNVIRLRQRAGLSQQALADLADTHWRHVQKVEHAETNATLETIARLARALKVHPSQLLRRQGR